MIFIIILFCTNSMIIDNTPLNQRSEQEHPSLLKDFDIGDKIKKVTTHDLYQLKRNNQVYVAKLFRLQYRHNFEQQLNILKRLKHPNIIQLVYYQSPDSESMGLWSCDMLILKNAKHGSLNQYIPLNGKFPESIARILFKQILSALKYAANIQPNGIIHPDLLPSSILLDEQRQVKICGWSKENTQIPKTAHIKNMLFNCCQILILMITSYPPFLKKNSTSDPLYKFLKPAYISKFWQHLHKKVSVKYKEFEFSNEIKQLIQKVFLGQWTTFEQIQACAWLKQPTPLFQEFTAILQKMENQSLEKRQKHIEQQQLRQEKKRKILQQYQEQTLRGNSSRSSSEYEFFIQDFYDNFFHHQDVPTSQCSELIRLYDERPNFIIASFKQNLRTLESDQINQLFGGEFKLISHSVEKIGNQAYVQMRFEELDTNQGDSEFEDNIQVRVKSLIRFFKNNHNNLYAQIKVLESNLSQYYANLMMNFIKDKIKLLNSE